MKSKVTILTIAAAFSVSGFALAASMPAKGAKAAMPAVEQAQPVAPVAAPAVDQAKPAAPAAAPVVEQPKLVLVGNKICPVSGTVIPADQLGKNTVEYKGMVFNLCCPLCKDKFLADAEKFAKVAQDEVAKEAADAAAAAAKPVLPVVEKK